MWLSYVESWYGQREVTPWIPFFGFLLFWLGFTVTATGTPIVAIRSTYREIGLMSVPVYFMMTGALLMGSAGVNFSYAPPSILSWPLAIALWTILIFSLAVAAIKPPYIKDKQEGTEPPK